MDQVVTGTQSTGSRAERVAICKLGVERMVNPTKDSCMRLPEMIQFEFGFIDFLFSVAQNRRAKNPITSTCEELLCCLLDEPAGDERFPRWDSRFY